MTIGTAEVCAVHMTRSAAGAVQPTSGVIRRPLSVVTDALGAPAPVSASDAVGPPVDGLASRVGDPVPVRVGSRSWPAEVLVALVIADAVAAVADEPAERLVLVVPDEWRAHRRAVVRDAVAELTEQSVTTVDASLGLVDPGAGEEAAGPVLVLTAGDESFRAHVFTHGDDGWQVHRTSRSDWGGNDIDDALVDFVGERSPSVRAKGAHDALAVRAACASAREDLARRTATEVELPGRDPVRLVRADLELLMGRTITDVVDQLVADVIDPHGDRPSRVLVTGCLASLPMVVEAVSGAVGMSVEHLTDEQALQRYADAGAVAMESSVVADSVDTEGQDDEDTQLLPVASLRPVPHQGHRRRTAILVAASLAAAGSVAAMTMTDAGEATLLSMVDGIVPQDSSHDTASGDLLGRLTDAATLPALPWGNGDDADDPAATNGTGEGTPAGENGTKGPSPTSTHGGGKDEDKKDEKDKKDKDSDKDSDKDKGNKDKDNKDKGNKDKGNKDKGKSSGKASAGSSSSSQGRTPNENSTSSADDPSTTPDNTSSAPDTPSSTSTDAEPDPTTSTPDPDPTTPTPDPDPTTPTPDPEPTRATGTASTTSDPTTVAAPATSEQSTSPEPGTP